MAWMATADFDILATLYDGVLDDARLEKSLALLAERFHSPSSALLSLDLAMPTANAFAASGIFGDSKALDVYHADFAPLDPAPAAFARSPALAATTTDRMIADGRIDAQSRATRTFVNEYFGPLGLVECLGANLSTRNGHTALIGIHRGRERKPYDEQDMRDLDYYIPHLSRALELRRAFADLSVKSGLLMAFIDRLAAGIIIVDPSGRVVLANRAVSDMAARGDGLGIDRSGLPYTRLSKDRQNVERLCADVRAGGAGGVARFQRKDGGLPYAIMVAPAFAENHIGLPGSDLPYTLIVIHDPDAMVESSIETIAHVFNLPPRTAAFVQALVRGETPGEYAERQGLSLNAVKFHLKTAFSRTGFRRQSELVKAVARAMADFGRRVGRD
jgi:PAS domain-containing protein